MPIRRRSVGVGRTLAAAFGIALVLGTGLLTYWFVRTPPTHQVTFMLEYQPSGFHGLFYYGLSHGIYSRAGLDVKIEPGSGSVSTISAVASGTADFGVADAGVLALTADTSNVSNVKIVAMVFQRATYSIIYNTARISKFADLANKTMGTTPGSGGVKLFAILTKMNGVNFSSIRAVYSSASTYVTLVALGQVDFIIATVNRFPVLQPFASQNGITLGEFTFVDYGLNMYGDALITTSSMINEHPDIVESFVKASLESVQDASKNPQDAVASVIQYNPQLNATLTLADFRAVASFTLPSYVNSTANPLTLGWTDQTRLQETADTVLAGYGSSARLNASTIFTNQFVAEPTP